MIQRASQPPALPQGYSPELLFINPPEQACRGPCISVLTSGQALKVILEKKILEILAL